MHFLAGVIAGVLVGGIGGYYRALAVFNRDASEVAKYVLAKRNPVVKTQ